MTLRAKPPCETCGSKYHSGDQHDLATASFKAALGAQESEPARKPLGWGKCGKCGSVLHAEDAHDASRPWAAQLLEGWANQLFARYGHPVYLVGSALEQENPRDVDVICVLPDDEFENRFGPWRECERFGPDQTPGSKRWCAEVGKLSREATAKHPSVNIDFKVRAAGAWWNQREDHKPKLRIDTVEDA